MTYAVDDLVSINRRMKELEAERPSPIEHTSDGDDQEAGYYFISTGDERKTDFLLIGSLPEGIREKMRESPYRPGTDYTTKERNSIIRACRRVFKARALAGARQGSRP